MAEKVVTKVWIAPGCIICDACETECPEIFDVQDHSSTIRGEAQQGEFIRRFSLGIIKAAEACPAEVIKFEAGEVAGEEVKAEVGVTEEVKAVEPEPQAKVQLPPLKIPDFKTLKNIPLDARLAMNRKK